MSCKLFLLFFFFCFSLILIYNVTESQRKLFGLIIFAYRKNSLEPSIIGANQITEAHCLQRPTCHKCSFKLTKEFIMQRVNIKPILIAIQKFSARIETDKSTEILFSFCSQDHDLESAGTRLCSMKLGVRMNHDRLIEKDFIVKLYQQTFNCF
jgi:hypothetical protein